MTVEELTAENLKLKETVNTLQEDLKNKTSTLEEDAKTIENLRSKNAELYSMVGSKTDGKDQTSTDVEDERAKFISNYIDEKIKKGV